MYSLSRICSVLFRGLKGMVPIVHAGIPGIHDFYQVDISLPV